jgi:hypothetical protein
MPLKDMAGLVVGSWTVLRYFDSIGDNVRWLCRCECGTEKPTYGSQLRNGRSTNCGCKRIAASRTRVPRNFTDLTGRRFGKLVVVRRKGTVDDTRALWECKCDCGGTSAVRTTALRCGKTVTCGCSHGEKHGLCGSGLYSIWHNMIARCTNPKAAGFKHYGGRGIRVCDRWSGDGGLQSFVADMSPRPSPEHEIDRKDSNGNYCPENCRWATRPEQCRNTRRSRLITIDGTTKCMTDWCKEFGRSTTTVTHRIVALGWDAHRALTTPTRRSGRA